jgi:hypothetical protein
MTSHAHALHELVGLLRQGPPEVQFYLIGWGVYASVSLTLGKVKGPALAYLKQYSGDEESRVILKETDLIRLCVDLLGGRQVQLIIWAWRSAVAAHSATILFGCVGCGSECVDLAYQL